MKADIVLLFVLMFVLIAVVYYVGFASDLLVGAKVIQQLVYFLTARTSSGQFQEGVTG